MADIWTRSRYSVSLSSYDSTLNKKLHKDIQKKYSFFVFVVVIIQINYAKVMKWITEIFKTPIIKSHKNYTFLQGL